MLLTRFLMINFYSMILILLIMLIKTYFAKYLSVKAQYMIWFPLLLSLGTVLLPEHVFRAMHPLRAIKQMHERHVWIEIGGIQQSISGSDWMQDFTETVYHWDFSMLKAVFSGIWLAGVFFGLLVLLLNGIELKRLKSSIQAPSVDLQTMLSQCQTLLGSRIKVRLYQSALVKSPMATGLIRPMILLPAGLNRQLKPQEISYILLHELLHVRHGHLWLNYLLCGIRLIYWCNPFVHFAFQQLWLDREIYCDYLVIATQGQENALAYGHTLLNFAQLMNRSSFPTASNLAGAKQQLKKRIQRIVDYALPTKAIQRTSLTLIFFITLLSVLQTSTLALWAADDDWYIPQEQLTIQTEDLSSYFNGKDGCFVLYNQNLDQFFIYNEQISRTRVAPNSTYKIFAALHALEQQQITPLNHRQTWDGQRYALSTWNQDQDLNSAMRYSVNWYFQGIDQQMGLVQIQQFLNQIHYGNCAVSAQPATYWLESALHISPLEQTVLLKKFYYNQWGFSEHNIEAVKDAIFLEQSNGSQLYGKTGTGNINGQTVNGWFIGYVQHSDKLYIFATYIKGPNLSGSQAAQISLDILHNYGIYSSTS